MIVSYHAVLKVFTRFDIRTVRAAFCKNGLLCEDFDYLNVGRSVSFCHSTGMLSAVEISVNELEHLVLVVADVLTQGSVLI
jgi:hypothetical protein